MADSEMTRVIGEHPRHAWSKNVGIGSETRQAVPDRSSDGQELAGVTAAELETLVPGGLPEPGDRALGSVCMDMRAAARETHGPDAPGQEG